MNPFFVTDFSISDSLKTVQKSVLIYETIIQISQATYYHKSLLNLCKINILQKKVATAMVTTRYFLNYSISET